MIPARQESEDSTPRKQSGISQGFPGNPGQVNV